MPGPWSTTSITASSPRLADAHLDRRRRPACACARSRAGSRATWRRRFSSPLTTTVPFDSYVTGRSGAAARRSSTAAPTSRERSTGSRSSGRPWSSRASSRRSSTSTPMRAAASSMRRHGLGEVVGPLARAAAEQLGVAANRSERRAQLVRRVGDEAAQARFRRGAFRERAFDLAEHRVEREPEPPDFAAFVGGLDAPGEVAGRDRARGLAHVLERLAARGARPTTRGAPARAAPRSRRGSRRGTSGAACGRRR